MKKLIYFAAISLLVGFFSLLPTPDEKSTDTGKGQNGSDFSALDSDFIITNVRLYDGLELLENATIRVKAGKVAAITRGQWQGSDSVPTLSGQGYTIMPGLVDAHTHNWGDAAAEALNFGVATELDMFTLPVNMQAHLMLRDKASNTTQADVFSAMYLATSPNGHGTQFGFDIPVLRSVTEVPEFVANRIEEGASYIKAVYFSPKGPIDYFPSISLEILETLAREAEQQGLKLLVHIDDLQSAKEAIRAGARGLVHSFSDQPADAEIISLMQENNVFLIPTLSVLASASHSERLMLAEDKRISAHLNSAQKSQLEQGFQQLYFKPEFYDNAVNSVQKLQEAGVVILAGSDAPNPGTTHGASLHEEMQRLVMAGLSPEQAIHSATGAASRVMPVGKRGTLSVGNPATFIMVEGNPFQRIEQSRAITGIWKHGMPLNRTLAEAETSSSEIITVTARDINLQKSDGDSPRPEVVVTSDKMMNGNSVGAINYATEAGHLTFKGEIKRGYMYPWTGVSLLLTERMGQIFDLSAAPLLHLRARTLHDSQPLTVLLMQQGLYQPFTHEVIVNSDWQDYKIDLREIPGVDLSQIVNISLVFMRTPAEYQLHLEKVRFE